MTISTRNINNNFNLVRMERPQAMTQAERINQINANNRQINNLEDQITAQKKVSAVTRELIAGSSESIALTKEIISTTKALMGAKKDIIANNEALISNSNREIDILERLRASSDRLIGVRQEQLGLLQESRDLTKESRDLNQKMINIMEKMIAIMMKNPAKYGGLSNTEIQKLPEVIEAKTQVTQLANSKVEQYPKKERAMLTDTVKSVVEVTFSEIKSPAADIKVDKELFFTLPKRIEAALDKKYESLSIKDFNKIIDANYRSVENFFRIKRLDYLDLALKDIKV